MSSSDCYDSVSIVSESTIVPDLKSPITSLQLSVSDLPLLTYQYIQKGCLFSGTLSSDVDLLSHLKLALSKTLSVFPPLAGRLSTDPSTGHVSISCSDDSGALFVHAHAPSITLNHILDPPYLPSVFRQFFALNDTLNYDGHSTPLLAVQLTQLSNAVFIGCTVNHAVVDGTSFWNFFNTFAEISRGASKVSRPPSFSRDDSVFNTHTDVLRFLNGRPTPTFSCYKPTRERIFHFSRQALLALKKKANESSKSLVHSGSGNGCGRESTVDSGNTVITTGGNKPTKDEISSFQSLSAQVWRSVTRARNLPASKTTSFGMSVNCRHRVNPKMDPLYFGNAIQLIKTVALAGEVVSRELGWSGDLLHRSVRAHDEVTVRKRIEEWERDPRGFQVENSDGAALIISSSPLLGMYDNDFGWGRPVAVRSGKANKFDGKFSAFPGREGGGSVELEVVLELETMAGLEKDDEFMQYVS